MNRDENKITETVKSNKGFYIGDICYALSDSVYHGIWGGADYSDGIHEDPETGFSFAVASTAYGDGTYEDDYGRTYGVDAGVLGIVPGELTEKGTNGGHYFPGAGEATLTACDGVFDITLPSGETIHINTEGDEDYEDEDEDEEWY